MSAYGATEGGSSGYPIVNKLGQVVGQLYGVWGSHLDGKCDYNNIYIIDGRFSVTYPYVQIECDCTWREPLQMKLHLIFVLQE